MLLSDPWSQIPNEQLQFDVEEPVCGPLLDSLAGWFRQALGKELTYLTRRVGGGGGFKSTIYFAVANGEEFAIRVPHRGTGWSARLIGAGEYHSIAGAYAATRLSALGQPVPKLVAMERDPALFGGPFAVWKRVRGVHMADYSEQWASWPYPEEQWGEFLRACHSIEPVHGTGPVDDEGIGLCASWAEYIRRISAAHMSIYMQVTCLRTLQRIGTVCWKIMFPCLTHSLFACFTWRAMGTATSSSTPIRTRSRRS